MVGMVQAKAVVMLGRKDNGPHPCPFGQRHGSIGIPVHGIETGCGYRVPVAGNACKRADLLTVSPCDRFAVIHSPVHRIQSKMNEHGIFLIQPLLRGLALG